jgi:hypothetical protein
VVVVAVDKLLPPARRVNSFAMLDRANQVLYEPFVYIKERGAFIRSPE